MSSLALANLDELCGCPQGSPLNFPYDGYYWSLAKVTTNIANHCTRMNNSNAQIKEWCSTNYSG